MAGHVFRRTFDRISGKFDRLLCHSIYRSQVQHHQKVYPFDNIDCADFCLPENVFIINFIANPRYIHVYLIITLKVYKMYLIC